MRSRTVAKHKQIVKELKRPDQFVDFWTRASHAIATFMGPRRKPALAAAVALAVVLVGAAIFNYWDETRRLAASQVLRRVQEIANADLLPDTKDTGKDADAPDTTAGKDKDAVPRFKTDGERQAAVVKELDAFLAAHGGTGLKAEALVMKGAALPELGKPDEAIAAYDGALAGRLDDRLRFVAHEGRGYAFEAKGELDKALAAFAQLNDDATIFQGFYKDRALYHRARLTEIKGDKVGAVEIYRQILAKVPDSAMKDEITDRLAVLEAK